MKDLSKSQNKFIRNTFCSLLEVEAFLCKYNKFSDIIKIAKIVKKHNGN